MKFIVVTLIVDCKYDVKIQRSTLVLAVKLVAEESYLIDKSLHSHVRGHLG